MVAIDGCCLDVADTPVNAEFFGRPGVSKGEKSAFPQARVVALAECGAHAIFDAVVGAYTSSEVALADELVGRLEPGMLPLADRGFYSFGLWRMAIGTGADLLWRVKTGLRPEYQESLVDDSWLACIRPTVGDRSVEPITVRVIDYMVDDGRDNPQSYRLFPTIMDPAVASATDLALAYAQRWGLALAFDELKTHPRGPRTVLRSKSPELVLQEVWGHLCCHFAIRTLMTDAASHAGHDPDRMSFVAALRITRQSVAHRGTFPPDDTDAVEHLWARFLRRLLARLNEVRRLRAAPRVIKRKMPRWHVKRAQHADWPQPRKRPAYAAIPP